MTTADYASGINGFRLLKSGGGGYGYQPTAEFTLKSASRLLANLPEWCELDFFDPEKPKEEAYVFVRRFGDTYQTMRVTRVSSKWGEEPFDRILELFMASPLVKKPFDDFPSFQVRFIHMDERKARHGDSFAPNRPATKPWWRFWR